MQESRFRIFMNRICVICFEFQSFDDCVTLPTRRHFRSFLCQMFSFIIFIVFQNNKMQCLTSRAIERTLNGRKIAVKFILFVMLIESLVKNRVLLRTKRCYWHSQTNVTTYIKKRRIAYSFIPKMTSVG